MTLTVRSASVTGATTASRALTHAEMDANWAHVIQSSNQSFLPSGIAAIDAATRTVAAKGADVVSIKDFKNDSGSAVAGDGSTDDSTGLQRGFNWLKNATTPACLFFPAGDYKHNTALTYSQGTNDINEKAVIGYGARLRGNLSVASPQLKITSSAVVRNFRWAGLGFYLGGSASAGLHIDGGNGTTGFFYHFSFRDFSVDTPSGDGVVFENTVFEGVFNAVSCYGMGATKRGFKTISGGGGVSSLSLIECNTQGGIIGLDVPSPVFDVRVIGGTYNSAEQEGIKYGNAAGALFQDVHVENNWNGAANLAAGGPGITANGSATFQNVFGTTNSKQKYVVGGTASSGKCYTVIGGAFTGSVTKFGGFAMTDSTSGLILVGDAASLTFDITGSGTVTTLSNTGITTGVSGATGSMPYALAKSAAAVSAPVDTTEDTLATITVPANALGLNGILRISAQWSFTNSGNAKTMRVRYSGGAGTVYFVTGLTVQLGVALILEIANRGATNSQVGWSNAMLDTGVATGSGKITSAVDTTASTTIVITGQKATAGETLTLESYLVELIPS